jgi:hypothetical protein
MPANVCSFTHSSTLLNGWDPQLNGFRLLLGSVHSFGSGAVLCHSRSELPSHCCCNITCGGLREVRNAHHPLRRAAQVGCDLRIVPDDFSPFSTAGHSPKLGLHGNFQKKNAAIAVTLCRDLDMQVASGAAPAALSDESLRPSAARRAQALREEKLPEEYLKGLAACRFPGRAQIAQVPLAVLPSFPLTDAGIATPPPPDHCSLSKSSLHVWCRCLQHH